MKLLPLGFMETPPKSPWGINFGGGLNSTAVIIECRNRGFRPDWILFADTGSEIPGTIEHVERMRQWCEGWQEVTTVRWIRKQGHHESVHENCLRSGYLPSKAYGHAGCTTKWKIQPVEKWRKERGLQCGAFAVGYDAGEYARITKACKRGDDPNMVAWYPLVAWGIDRKGCGDICEKVGIKVGKSSCFCCPNMQIYEWEWLRVNHPDLFSIALKIEENAKASGNLSDGVSWPMLSDREWMRKHQINLFDVLEDRCHHGGCMT
jgi:hypothetical protein